MGSDGEGPVLLGPPSNTGVFIEDGLTGSLPATGDSPWLVPTTLWLGSKSFSTFEEVDVGLSIYCKSTLMQINSSGSFPTLKYFKQISCNV